MKSDIENQIIRCRPVGYLWLAGFFNLSFAVFLYAYFFEPPTIKDTGDAIAAVLMLAMVGVPAAIFTLLGWRGAIIGDAKGLRWRRLRKWKSADWSEVKDFYHLREGKQATYQIETNAGKVSFSQGLESNAEKLAELITLHSTNAKYRTWGVRGLRESDDEPLVFENEIYGNLFMGALSFITFGGLCVWPFVLEIWHGRVFREFGLILWQFPPFARLIFLIFCVGMWCGIALLPWISMGMAWSGWRRRREIIKVTPEGIQWSDGVQYTMAKWNEVTELHVEKAAFFDRNFWLETAQGGFSFGSSLQGHFFLIRLIDHHAPHLQANAKLEIVETLGDEKLKWSGKYIGEGARIYHFRTNMNRAGLWFPTSVCFLPLLLPILRSVNPNPEGGDPTVVFLFISGIAWIGTIVGWLYFYRSMFRVTEQGLERITPFKKQFIAWKEIEKLEGNGGYRIYGAGERIGILSYFPADWAELKAEIARRAVNVSEGWQNVETQTNRNKFEKNHQSRH